MFNSKVSTTVKMAKYLNAIVAICIFAAVSMTTAEEIARRFVEYRDMEETVFSMDQSPKHLARNLKILNSLYMLAGITTERARFVSELLELQGEHSCKEENFDKFRVERFTNPNVSLEPYFDSYRRQQRLKFYLQCEDKFSREFSKPLYDSIQNLPRKLEDQLYKLITAMVGEGGLWHTNVAYNLARFVHKNQGLIVEKWNRKEKVSMKQFNDIFKKDVVDSCNSMTLELKQKAQFFLRNVIIDPELLDATRVITRKWVTGVYFCNQITAKPAAVAAEVYKYFVAEE